MLFVSFSRNPTLWSFIIPDPFLFIWKWYCPSNRHTTHSNGIKSNNFHNLRFRYTSLVLHIIFYSLLLLSNWVALTSSCKCCIQLEWEMLHGLYGSPLSIWQWRHSLTWQVVLRLGICWEPDGLYCIWYIVVHSYLIGCSIVQSVCIAANVGISAYKDRLSRKRETDGKWTAKYRI